MRLRIAMAIALMFLFASTAGLAVAQEPTDPATQTTKATQPKTKTLTGCLQKGDVAGQFKLSAKDGATWELESTTLKFDEHVGHTVSITGDVTKKPTKKSGMKEGEKKAGVAMELGRLSVTKLVHVSDTCQ